MTSINLYVKPCPPACVGSDCFSSSLHTTTEFLRAYQTCSHAEYCRPQAGLCRAFIAQLDTAQELSSLRRFFPFIRLASVLEFPRTQKNLPQWLALAFAAGRQLGAARPASVDEILPDHALHKARRSLNMLKQTAGDARPTAATLLDAFARVVECQWSQVSGSELDHVYCDAAIRALRAGYFSITAAAFDPCLAEFCDELATETFSPADLTSLALASACAFEWEAALIYRMEHPLLRLARQLHPADPSAQAELLALVHATLEATGIRSENEDPLSLRIQLAFWHQDRDSAGEGDFRGRQLERMVRQLDRQWQMDSLPA